MSEAKAPLEGLGNLIFGSSKRPKGLGGEKTELEPCPSTPNCVCTREKGKSHGMDPVPFEGDPEKAMDRIEETVRSMERTKIVTRGGNYLHAEFKSRLWGFVDDVEFLLDPEARMVHFRSASRVGRSDLGANRKRMEDFVRRFKVG